MAKMNLEEINRIMKEYNELDSYVRVIGKQVADARNLNYSYLEDFSISGNTIAMCYTFRNHGDTDYDSFDFNIALLTEDPSDVAARLNAEAQERKEAEKRRSEKQHEMRLAEIEKRELAEYRKLRSKYEGLVL